jgi:hypothetical protein
VTDHDILTADEVAAMLRRKSKRALDRRHEWTPAFPAPFSRWPLTWLRADVLAWIEARHRLQQRKAA